MQEKFSIVAVASLRSDILHSGLDSFQAAESIKVFVARHGYGISAEVAREVATSLEGRYENAESLRRHLDKSAWVM
jgi:hypothetical protein